MFMIKIKIKITILDKDNELYYEKNAPRTFLWNAHWSGLGFVGGGSGTNGRCMGGFVVLL
jgi:hypothetical protein